MYLSGRTKTAAYFSKTAFNLFSESSSESISITFMLSKFLIAVAFSDKSKFVSLVCNYLSLNYLLHFVRK